MMHTGPGGSSAGAGGSEAASPGPRWLWEGRALGRNGGSLQKPPRMLVGVPRGTEPMGDTCTDTDEELYHRNRLPGLWSLRSPAICRLQGGDPGGHGGDST